MLKFFNSKLLILFTLLVSSTAHASGGFSWINSLIHAFHLTYC